MKAGRVVRIGRRDEEGTGSARSGAADQAAAASVDRLSYASGYWGGRQKFVLPAFDRAQGEATVYALDSAPSFNAETVAHAAKVLGVSGKVKPNKGSAGWRVRSKEGTKPEISLSAWGASEISYSSGLENPVWECIDQTVSPDYENYEDVYQECLRTTPQPTEQQARDAMDTVLEAFGIDASTVSVEIVDDDLEYDNTLLVRASRVVDGMASPLSIETTLAHGGILWAYGSPGELVSLGSYRIVSPAEAAERLNFSAFSPELTYVEPVDPEMLPGAEEVEEPTAPAPVPKRGSAVPWSLAEHEIVSARLGMTAVHGPDRVVYAVPAYEFTDSDGSRWSVIALEETSLDLSRSPGGWWW
ncbi:hypothetical protein [Leucobacter soli]|uniref:hypothetical protein n=1 Tax=Leucobacter soli TaxID=2812850 RepID=UPI00360C8520